MFRNISRFLDDHEVLKMWVQVMVPALLLGTVLGLAGYGVAEMVNCADIAVRVFKVIFYGIVGIATLICTAGTLYSLVMPKSM